MMKSISLLSLPLLGVLFSLLFVSCEKERLDPNSVVDANAHTLTPTELDAWITTNVVKPYNIEVVYRWDKNVAGVGTSVYPPKLEKVQAVLEAVCELGLELYTHPSLGGENFLRERTPLRIVLYGGGNPDNNGVERLYNPQTSAAELSLYHVNDYDPGAEEQVYVLMRSVHHQMARRLLELLPYDRDAFLKISESRYTRGSTDVIAPPIGSYTALKEKFGLNGWANQRGCYTMLSLLSAEDDFAEIISATLVSSPQEINAALTRAGTPEDEGDPDPDPEVHQRYAREAEQAYKEFSAKQQFVTAYIRKRWGVDFLRLQLASVRRIDTYLKNHK